MTDFTNILHPLDSDIAPLVRVPRLRAFFEYWRSKRGGQPMPARAALDPIDFRYLLGDIVICDVFYEPVRFLYRLHGVNLVQRDGIDMTGRWLHDHPDVSYAARVERGWSMVVAERKLLRGDRLRRTGIDGRQRRYETLVLPLAADGNAIDKLVTIQAALDDDGEYPPRDDQLTS